MILDEIKKANVTALKEKDQVAFEYLEVQKRITKEKDEIIENYKRQIEELAKKYDEVKFEE